MFTVKATYHGEIRKFSFPDLTAFPTFDQICSQLYRVFPINHNFYLHNLLFFSDASLPGRILIGREVHNADDYKKIIQPHKHHFWSHALLRFNVLNEPSPQENLEEGGLHVLKPIVDDSWIKPCDFGTLAPTRDGNHRHQYYQPPPPPISLSHIPPPPIIFSSSCTMPPPPPPPPQLPMEVDFTPFSGSQQGSLKSWPYPSPQFGTSVLPSEERPCCSISEAKVEVQALLSNFQQDLTRILTSTFGSAGRPSQPVPFESNVPLDNCSSPSTLCSLCALNRPGNWYTCEQCHVIICSTCHQLETPSFCFSAMGSHNLKELPRSQPTFQASLASMPPVIPNIMPPGWSTTAPTFGDFRNHNQFSSMWHPQIGSGFTGSAPNTFNQNLSAFATPFIPPQSTFTPARNLSDSPAVPENPSNHSVEVTMHDATSPAPVEIPPSLVVHQGIVCDVCSKTVQGIRHKCLDCPDYDLCSSCMSTGAAERHDPFHEFFDIIEPGRVIVHTVFSGAGEREATPAGSTRPSASENLGAPAAHLASCDLCDSKIFGDRYKCQVCPDFDTCSSCFSITTEQHPGHAFVKICKPSDYISRQSGSISLHMATCNSCFKDIYGARFKCMHPDCPDFDLCQSCEAHPIPVHPANHPLLKMKAAETIIPTVYRIGQRGVIDTLGIPSSRTPTPRVTSKPPQDSGLRNKGKITESPMITTSKLHTGEGERETTPADNVVPDPPLRPSFVFGTPPIPVPIPMPARIPLPSNIGASPLPTPPLLRQVTPPLAPSWLSILPPPPVPAWPSWPVLQATAVAKPAGEQKAETDRTRQHFEFMTMSNSTLENEGFDALSKASSERTKQHPSHDLLTMSDSSFTKESRFTNCLPIQALLRTPSPPPSMRNSTPPAELLPVKMPARFDPSSIMSLLRTPTPPPAQPLSVQALLRAPSPGLLQKMSWEPDDLDQAPSFVRDVSKTRSLPPMQPSFVDGFKKSVGVASSSIAQAEAEKVESPVITAGHTKWPALDIGGLFQELRTLQKEREVTQSVIGEGDVVSLSSEGSPLGGEALLNRPEDIQGNSAALLKSFSLAALLHGFGDESEKVKKDQKGEVIKEADFFDETKPTKIFIEDEELNAEFVKDVTVLDGQVFPPGAEFVKCWRMANNGDKDWPAETELVFVAGESLALEKSQAQTMRVGSVKVGEEVDLWTGELKAPDVPGRYVGYWRLRDEQKRLFGHSIWVEINVADDQPSSGELSSSSIIVMPQGASELTCRSVDDEHSSTSGIVTESEMSDIGKDSDSDVSLISVPSSLDEEDEEWEESRGAVDAPAVTQAMEYVVLYDDDESSEDD